MSTTNFRELEILYEPGLTALWHAMCRLRGKRGNDTRILIRLYPSNTGHGGMQIRGKLTLSAIGLPALPYTGVVVGETPEIVLAKLMYKITGGGVT